MNTMKFKEYIEDDVDEGGYGGTRHKKDSRDAYNKRRKGKGMISADVEKEARTYRDRQDDDEKKKKKRFAFGGKQDNIRSGGKGYGKHGEEVEEGWKKGKYTIKDDKGNILGTYNSGDKANKAMNDLMQKGDYQKLTVSMVEKVEVDEDAKMGKQTDDNLRKIYKKALAMDQSSPANKFMTKRIAKEMKKRGLKEEEIDEAHFSFNSIPSWGSQMYASGSEGGKTKPSKEYKELEKKQEKLKKEFLDSLDAANASWGDDEDYGPVRKYYWDKKDGTKLHVAKDKRIVKKVQDFVKKYRKADTKEVTVVGDIKEETEIDEGKSAYDKEIAAFLKKGGKIKKLAVSKKEVAKAAAEFRKSHQKMTQREIELDLEDEIEAMSNAESVIVEGEKQISVKEFDALKKGDIVEVEFGSAMSGGKTKLKVTAKNTVNKGRVEKVTMKSVARPNSVKFYFYKRDNDVSMAQGDMGVNVKSFTKEEVMIDEKKKKKSPVFKGTPRQIRQQMKDWKAKNDKLHIGEDDVDEAIPHSTIGRRGGGKKGKLKQAHQFDKQKDAEKKAKEIGGQAVQNIKDGKWFALLWKEEVELDEAKILKKGAKVQVAHPAKGKGMVTGKVVRYDDQGPGSPFYVVDIGELRSEKVPAHKIKEEVELVEKWEEGAVYHQEFSNGDRAYFRADFVLKNKRWKGLQVDEFGGKQKKAKLATANESLSNWKITPKNEIPKALKEEIVFSEGQELQAKMALDDAGIKYSTKNNSITVKKKDLKKAQKAFTKSFKKGGWPTLKVEEVVVEAADRDEVMEFKAFIENDPRLEKSKIIPIVKNIQRKMAKDQYDHKKAPKLWMYLVKEAAKLYAKEFDGLTYGSDVHKEVAQQLADDYKAEIEAQDGKMYESKFQTYFQEFGEDEEDTIEEQWYLDEIYEVLSEILLEKKITLDYSKAGSNPNSPEAKMKKAFDDAGIKMKPRDGKIVVAKKDKEKARAAMSKSPFAKASKKIVDMALDKFFIFEVEIKEKELATPAFNDLAFELMGYVDEDERVIKKLHKPLVKKLSKDFDAGKYNHGKATKEWAVVIEKALNMNSSFKKQVLSQTMSGKKVGEALIEYVAKMLAKEYKDELEAAKKNGSDVMDMFESEVITEVLKSKDKSVIDAFYDKKPLEGRLLDTDGKSLDKVGMGKQQIAKWVNGKIKITAVSDVKSTESILKYMKASIPKNNFEERDYRKEYDNYQGKPEQIARRSSRNQARRVMGDDCEEGKDVGHKDNNPLNNDRKNLRNEDPSKNRREPRLRKMESFGNYFNRPFVTESSRNDIYNGSISAGVELEKYAKKSGGIDKDDMLATAAILKKGKLPSIKQIPGDTDPRDKIFSIIGKHLSKKYLKKYKGFSPALDNAMKEEWQIEERKLSDTELKRREEIAQELKDDEFKKRYGDDWKSVKMGVATNMAKKEAMESVDYVWFEARYKYKIDHKTYTSAVEEALIVADKQGYEVDMDDYFNKIATGPRKPQEGKTNIFKIALEKGGKEQKKKLQIQIYGKGKHGYELNCYIQ